MIQDTIALIAISAFITTLCTWADILAALAH